MGSGTVVYGRVGSGTVPVAEPVATPLPPRRVPRPWVESLRLRQSAQQLAASVAVGAPLTRDYPRLPEIARGYPRLPDVTRDCPRLPEIARDYPRLPEIARDYPVTVGAPAVLRPAQVEV